jgi:hypothetical protein
MATRLQLFGLLLLIAEAPCPPVPLSEKAEKIVSFSCRDRFLFHLIDDTDFCTRRYRRQSKKKRTA